MQITLQARLRWAINRSPDSFKWKSLRLVYSHAPKKIWMLYNIKMTWIWWLDLYRWLDLYIIDEINVEQGILKYAYLEGASTDNLVSCACMVTSVGRLRMKRPQHILILVCRLLLQYIHFLFSHRFFLLEDSCCLPRTSGFLPRRFANVVTHPMVARRRHFYFFLLWSKEAGGFVHRYVNCLKMLFPQKTPPSIHIWQEITNVLIFWSLWAAILTTCATRPCGKFGSKNI